MLQDGLLAAEMVDLPGASIIVSTQHRPEAVGFSEPTATLLAALAKRMNSCIPACVSSLGLRLSFERGIRVSVCGDLLNVFLKEILLFPVARTGLRERIRVPAAADYLRSPREQ